MKQIIIATIGAATILLSASSFANASKPTEQTSASNCVTNFKVIISPWDQVYAVSHTNKCTRSIHLDYKKAGVIKFCKRKINEPTYDSSNILPGQSEIVICTLVKPTVLTRNNYATVTYQD